MSAPAPQRSGANQIGHNELGTISVNPSVVGKIASRASIDIPQIGAAQTRMLGMSLPGAGLIGGRQTDLSALPKAVADVHGASATIDLEVAVLWPHSVREVTERLRSQVINEVSRICGIQVSDVRISVLEFATSLTRRQSRVR